MLVNEITRIPGVPSAWVEQFEQKLSWEEAVSTGMVLRETKDSSQWQLGDLALQVEKAYGDDAIGKFSIDIGINKKSLQQYRRVSAAFPKGTRSNRLSHRHHLLLAAHDDRFDLLKEAEDNSWTTSQLELKLSKHPQAQLTKKEVALCQNCHKFLVKTGEICSCIKN